MDENEKHELSAKEQTIEQLQTELQFYRSALNALPNPIFIKNSDARFVFFNKSYDTFFQVDSSQILGTAVYEAEHLDEKDKKRYHIEDTNLLKNQNSVNYEINFALEDGVEKPTLYWSCGFCTPDAKQTGIVGEIVEISSIKKLQSDIIHKLVDDNKDNNIALTENNTKTAFENIMQFFTTILDFYCAESVNVFEFDFEEDSLCGGYNLKNDGTKRNFEKKCMGITSRNIYSLLEYIKKYECIPIDVSELNFVDRDIIDFVFPTIKKVVMVPILAEDGLTHGFIVVENPTQNIEQTEILQSIVHFVLSDVMSRSIFKKIANANFTDKLTGVYNRNKYNEAIKSYEKNSPQTLGILIADINGLRLINDLYGEASGDKLLENCAGVLKDVFGNHVYRIGGDEMAVLYENIQKEDFYNLTVELKEQIQDCEFCDMSFGFVYLCEEKDIVKKISYATELMNLEKQEYYKSLSHRQIKVGKMLHSVTQNLLKELDRGLFQVYLQPQFLLKTEEVIGAEALIRKTDLEGNIIPPIKFLPYYEQERVIRHIDMFVVEQVCEKIAEWKTVGMEMKIAVNLSRITLMERNIISDIAQICDKYSVPHRLLELEVTETSNSIENKHLKEKIDEAINTGFSVSLDDFGTEYSNLLMLSNFNFSQVKFDRGLIDNICDDSKSKTIVEHAINMCKSLHIEDDLAEGIETLEQKQLLVSINCRSGQGYYFSKPIPIDEFESKYVRGYSRS